MRPNDHMAATKMSTLVAYSLANKTIEILNYIPRQRYDQRVMWREEHEAVSSVRYDDATSLQEMRGRGRLTSHQVQVLNNTVTSSM